MNHKTKFFLWTSLGTPWVFPSFILFYFLIFLISKMQGGIKNHRYFISWIIAISQIIVNDRVDTEDQF